MKPWKIFLMNIANLFKVKIIITLIIVFTFCYLTIKDQDVSSEFMILAVTAIVNYYFTNGNDKNNLEEKDNE